MNSMKRQKDRMLKDELPRSEKIKVQRNRNKERKMIIYDASF